MFCSLAEQQLVFSAVSQSVDSLDQVVVEDLLLFEQIGCLKTKNKTSEHIKMQFLLVKIPSA